MPWVLLNNKETRKKINNEKTATKIGIAGTLKNLILKS